MTALLKTISRRTVQTFIFCALVLSTIASEATEGLPLYYWRMEKEKLYNFGDCMSVKLLERIVGGPVEIYKKTRLDNKKKLLAIGSIISFGIDDDVIWGSGINGKLLHPKFYNFETLDVRSVRGPLTRQFLYDNFKIECPEVYGDPALLTSYFFPEFKRKDYPKYDYIIIPHYSEEHLFPKDLYPNAVYPTDPFEEIIEKIVDSKLVVSSTLHGLIVAESWGVPARMLKITNQEPMFKYQDYYYGTNRFGFQFATSIEEALIMGGEEPFQCDLKKLYESFPFEFWPNTQFNMPNF